MIIHVSFDPRNDRVARDIRNVLARLFVKCLDPETDLAPVNKWAGQVLAKHPGQIYEEYLFDRQHRYLVAKETISRQKKLV